VEITVSIIHQFENTWTSIMNNKGKMKVAFQAKFGIQTRTIHIDFTKSNVTNKERSCSEEVLDIL
jgi:hypothetical protein